MLLGSLAVWSFIFGLAVLLLGGHTPKRVGTFASGVVGFVMMMIALLAFILLLLTVMVQRLTGWS